MKKTFIIFTDGVIILSVFFLPALIVAMPDGIGACIFWKHGILCPSCGGTRCVFNFFSGNFVLAFRYNHLIFFALIYAFAFLVLLNIHVFVKNKYTFKVLKAMSHYSVAISFSAAYLLFGIFRNIIR